MACEQIIEKVRTLLVKGQRFLLKAQGIKNKEDILKELNDKELCPSELGLENYYEHECNVLGYPVECEHCRSISVANMYDKAV